MNEIQYKKTVLIVDDDKQIHDLLGRTLKLAGFDLMHAKNGQEALRAIKENQPDIILLDVHMPVMDGIEVLTQIKSDDTTKSIPVIMLTSLEDSPEHVETAKNFGAADFFSKDTPLSEIINRVKEVLD